MQERELEMCIDDVMALSCQTCRSYIRLKTLKKERKTRCDLTLR